VGKSSLYDVSSFPERGKRMTHQGRKALPADRDGDTHDAFSRNWRWWLCCLKRPGVIKKTRRRFHKRARREAKKEKDP